MRRLVLSVLVALGLLVATPKLADATSTSELTYSTVATGPTSQFDGTCDYSLSWTVKDPSKVATGDLPYPQTQTLAVRRAGGASPLLSRPALSPASWAG